MLAHKTVSEQR